MCEALRRYRERQGLVRDALVHLYNLIADGDEPRPDILKVQRLTPGGGGGVCGVCFYPSRFTDENAGSKPEISSFDSGNPKGRRLARKLEFIPPNRPGNFPVDLFFLMFSMRRCPARGIVRSLCHLIKVNVFLPPLTDVSNNLLTAGVTRVKPLAASTKTRSRIGGKQRKVAVCYLPPYAAL